MSGRPRTASTEHTPEPRWTCSLCRWPLLQAACGTLARAAPESVSPGSWARRARSHGERTRSSASFAATRTRTRHAGDGWWRRCSVPCRRHRGSAGCCQCAPPLLVVLRCWFACLAALLCLFCCAAGCCSVLHHCCWARAGVPRFPPAITPPHGSMIWHSRAAGTLSAQPGLERTADRRFQ